MNKEVMFSSASGEWRTPKDLYRKLDKEFHFKLDPCAHPLPRYWQCETNFTEDGIKATWSTFKTIYVNPPYGRELGKWVEKARKESLQGAIVVMLLPARTDTKWFHDIILPFASEIRFIKGRLKFSGHVNSAPFPSMIIVFQKKEVSA